MQSETSQLLRNHCCSEHPSEPNSLLCGESNCINPILCRRCAAKHDHNSYELKELLDMKSTEVTDGEKVIADSFKLLDSLMEPLREETGLKEFLDNQRKSSNAMIDCFGEISLDKTISSILGSKKAQLNLQCERNIENFTIYQGTLKYFEKEQLAIKTFASAIKKKIGEMKDSSYKLSDAPNEAYERLKDNLIKLNTDLKKFQNQCRDLDDKWAKQQSNLLFQKDVLLELKRNQNLFKNIPNDCDSKQYIYSKYHKNLSKFFNKLFAMNSMIDSFNITANNNSSIDKIDAQQNSHIDIEEGMILKNLPHKEMILRSVYDSKEKLNLEDLKQAASKNYYSVLIIETKEKAKFVLMIDQFKPSLFPSYLLDLSNKKEYKIKKANVQKDILSIRHNSHDDFFISEAGTLKISIALAFEPSEQSPDYKGRTYEIAKLVLKSAGFDLKMPNQNDVDAIDKELNMYRGYSIFNIYHKKFICEKLKIVANDQRAHKVLQNEWDSLSVDCKNNYSDFATYKNKKMKSTSSNSEEKILGKRNILSVISSKKKLQDNQMQIVVGADESKNNNDKIDMEIPPKKILRTDDKVQPIVN